LGRNEKVFQGRGCDWVALHIALFQSFHSWFVTGPLGVARGYVLRPFRA
jgi:hypothetical protein